jgi:hypothetical protein
MKNVKKLLAEITEIEKNTLVESKFLGSTHKHHFSEEIVEDEDEKKPENDEIEKIKESLTKAYEDFISKKPALTVDKSIQPKKDNEELNDEDDFSFTAKVKNKDKTQKFECRNAKTFENTLLKIMEHPNFGGLVSYSYPVKTLNEHVDLFSLSLKLFDYFRFLPYEKYTEKFNELTKKLNSVQKSKIKQIIEILTKGNELAKQGSMVDEDAPATGSTITPVAPANSTITPTTTQNTTQPQTNTTQQQNTNQQNTQQQQQQPQQPPKTATSDALTNIEGLLDAIKKNPSQVDTLKKNIANLPH